MGYYDSMQSAKFSDLVGKTLVSVTSNNDEVVLKTESETYRLHHSQDCCENVFIESVVGDLNDLVGTPVFMAEEVNNASDKALSEYAESFTWTFYKLATIKGYVDIRFYGSSNGYYSESVDFVKMKNND